MKNQVVTTGIVLSRTDFGEADRIISVLTPDNGKLSMMARGVRKHKSKLAGGIELFSTSNITYLPGKGDIGTLVSSRLIKHYDHIVSDIARVQLGYELIKQLNRSTEDNCEPAYYHLLDGALAALDDVSISTDLIRAWFQAQLLRLAGHGPNLRTDTLAEKLVEEQHYNFDFEHMAFIPHSAGRFNASHIKLLRLYFSDNSPSSIFRVHGIDNLQSGIQTLLSTLYQQQSNH